MRIAAREENRNHATHRGSDKRHAIDFQLVEHSREVRGVILRRVFGAHRPSAVAASAHIERPDVVVRVQTRGQGVEVVRVTGQAMDAYQGRVTLRSVIQVVEREAV